MSKLMPPIYIMLIIGFTLILFNCKNDAVPEKLPIEDDGTLLLIEHTKKELAGEQNQNSNSDLVLTNRGVEILGTCLW